MTSTSLISIKTRFQSKVGRDIITVYSGKVADAVVGMTASILVGRALGPEQLGILVTIVSFANIVTGLMGYGLDITVVKFIADNRKPGGDKCVLSNSLLLRIGFILLIGSVTILTGWLSPHLFPRAISETSLVLVCVTLAGANSLATFVQAALRGHERYSYIVVTSLLPRLLRLALLVVIFAVGGRVEGVLLANILAGIFTVIIGGYFIQNNLSENPAWKIQKNSLVSIARYSFWIYISGILGVIYNNMNVLMLDKLSIASSVGYYAVAMNLLRPLEFLPETLNHVFLPKMSRIKTKRDILLFVKKILVIGGGASACVAPFIVFPELILDVVYGEEFNKAALALRLLALYMAINITLNPFSLLVHRFNMPALLSIFGTSEVVLGFFSNLYFIPLFGGEAGCAVTLIIASIFSKLLVAPWIFRRIKECPP